MYYKVARQIYKELAIKHELPIDTIEQICRAPLEMFEWNHYQINGKFSQLLIPSFAHFHFSIIEIQNFEK